VHIAILINARLGSKRLPKKHLRDVAGKTAIERVIDRVNVGIPIIIATGSQHENKELEPIAHRNKVEIFFGDQFNIPNRHLQIARHYKLDAIISIDADDLLTSQRALGCVWDDIKNYNMPLSKTAGLPLGMNIIWAYTVENLIKAIQNVKPKEERSTETGWGWLFDGGLLSTVQLPTENADKIRATLDYPEDLAFFREVYKKCPKDVLEDDTKLCAYLVQTRMCNINKKRFVI
jgi:spore coat polysaccharide biosynthesis protein SpsF